MKKYLFTALAFAVALVSCDMNDDSVTGDYSLIENIGKKDSGQTLNLKSGEPAEFAPVLQYTTRQQVKQDFTEEDYAKYDFDWRMSLNPGGTDTTRYRVGTGYPLNLMVSAYPSNEYNLLLRLTHKETGMIYQLTWRTGIEVGEIGSGLLVAYTRDEGQTSDMGLIRSHQFMSNSSGAGYGTPIEGTTTMPYKVFYDLFSAGNAGVPADGEISSIATTPINMASTPTKTDIQIVVKDKHLYRLDPSTFAVDRADYKMFFFPPAPNFKWAPKSVQPAASVGMTYQRMILLNGNNTQWCVNTGGYYNAPYKNDYQYELSDVFVCTSVGNPLGYGQFFDTKGGRIVRTNTSGLEPIPFDAAGGGSAEYDHNNLGGFDPIYAGNSAYNTSTPSVYATMWLLKEKATGKYFIYVIRHNDAWSACYISSKIDLSNCTDIDKSVAWTNSYRMNRASNSTAGGNYGAAEFFYAVGQNVYSVLVTPEMLYGSTRAAAPTANHAFTLNNAAETITHLRWTVEQGSMFFNVTADGKPQYHPSNATPHYTSINRMLVLASYNEGTKEGKIYAVPREFEGAGMFLGDGITPCDPTYAKNGFNLIGQWGGFGRITAIGYRDRF